MPSNQKDYESGSCAQAGAEETDTRQRIVAAAGDLFVQYGYSRATTRLIAKAAGVSEVTLFRYFDSKEALLKAVMESFGTQSAVHSIESRLTWDYPQDMLLIGRFIMGFILTKTKNMRFVLSEAANFPEIRPLFAQMPVQFFKALAGYLQKQMENGKIRKLHPEAAAQSFFSAFFAFGMCRELLSFEPQPEISADDAAVQIVGIFVRGTIAQ